MTEPIKQTPKTIERNGYKLVDGVPKVTDAKKAPKNLYLSKGRYTLKNGKYVPNRVYGSEKK